MAFLKSLVQQWHKADLGYSLLLNFRRSEEIIQLFNGATDIKTVTNLIAALVYCEGEPIWLTKENQDTESPLKDELVFKCLVINCQILFIKVSQQSNLNQAERLILTLSNVWVNQKRDDQSSDDLIVLIKKIYSQVYSIELESRNVIKNMK
ncbi:hypothetical protein [Shewanella psychromarinicola]|uniref:Uncharacterized protein n=1 Tax=Shewanella psychromarinicola TaxID=2487742 RepID=A0A3N4EH59_9GAMM|nr:hypothetical protein [Shewanella psychromarinicola]AZG34652.1 hypothetical protein EGC80_06760 [Shewanella psychromarinicola]MCL1083903.1 hypothetical protein [Shewanella psychromarinicola]RPA33560.1 hypothetical protein EGC77_09610 [Shewanella psychromarinicola]